MKVIIEIFKPLINILIIIILGLIVANWFTDLRSMYTEKLIEKDKNRDLNNEY